MRASFWLSARGAIGAATSALGLLTALSAATLPAAAQAGPLAVMAAFAVGKSAAAAAAQNAHGGRVLSVEQVVDNGRVVYKVKLLLNGGVIKIVTVDGETGKVI